VSLQLIPREEPKTYNIQFILDATSPCCVRVFYFANENDLPAEVPSYMFESGLGQLFTTGDDGFLNMNNRSEDELKENEENHTYPVIISIEAIPVDECEADSKEKKILSLTTLATILKCSDDTYEIKPIEQKIIYGGVTYLVHDIYGIDQNSSATPDECVICLTEMRDTVVIPCRHLCVCHRCAQVLRYQSNKCPICRGNVRSMLKIKIKKSDQPVSGETESGESDGDKKKSEEVLLLNTNKKSKKKREPVESESNDVSLT